ncbi:MAG: ABC transporter permease [Pseudomonadota bacterium]
MDWEAVKQPAGLKILYGSTASRSILDRLNLIWTLLWQSFVPRNKRESMKLVWVFLEPAGQLAVLVIVFSLVGKTADYGRSFPIFLLTGISMLTLYNAASQSVAVAVISLPSPVRLPHIGLFHDAIAQLLFAWITTFLSVLLIWGFITWYEGHATMPQDWFRCLGALGLAGFLGFGMGMIRGYCKQFIPALDRIYTVFRRALLFISGIFYVPSFLPPFFRDALAWNPILQAVEMNRKGFYGEDYPSIVFSLEYLVTFVLSAVTFGMLLLWFERRRIMG